MTVDLLKLKELAALFAPYATLYEVGGCVRDELLGCECGDVDVCSPLTVDEVKRALANTPFTVSDRNLRMGTVHISADGFCVEYTTFRTDSYDRSSGAHTPSQVRFTADIAEDALRRDFKCNAVYKNILTGQTVDPLGGEEDIKRRMLSAADKPDAVFEADGLRILRLVRFACELGFCIEEDTTRSARQNAWRVKDIAAERVREELSKIFIADTAHPSLTCRHGASCKETAVNSDLGDITFSDNMTAEKSNVESGIPSANTASWKENNETADMETVIKVSSSEKYAEWQHMGEKAHVRGVRLLDELGLVDLLLPELAEIKNLQQPKKYHLYNAYEHSLKAFEVSPPHLRWAALLHDVGKRRAYELSGRTHMHGHDEIGAEMVREVMNRLRFSNAEKARIVGLVRWHMIDIKGDMSTYKLRRFAAEHSDIADELCIIKDADAEASCGYRPEINRFRDVWNEVKSDGTPLCVKDLKVNGNDLISLGIEEKQIGVLLEKLWEDTVLNPVLNDRKKALSYIENMIKQLL